MWSTRNRLYDNVANSIMTDNTDYRMYLENQFKTIHDTLTRIEAQTVKTNGRVAELETEMLTHPMNCSSAKKVEKMSEDLEEYRIVKKYPKIAIYIIAFFVITAIFGAYNFIDIKNKMYEQTVQLKRTINDQEGVSKVTRGDYVKYNDGGLSDSIKLPYPR